MGSSELRLSTLAVTSGDFPLDEGLITGTRQNHGTVLIGGNGGNPATMASQNSSQAQSIGRYGHLKQFSTRDRGSRNQRENTSENHWPKISQPFLTLCLTGRRADNNFPKPNRQVFVHTLSVPRTADTSKETDQQPECFICLTIVE